MARGRNFKVGDAPLYLVDTQAWRYTAQLASAEVQLVCMGTGFHVVHLSRLDGQPFLDGEMRMSVHKPHVVRNPPRQGMQAAR